MFGFFKRKKAPSTPRSIQTPNSSMTPAMAFEVLGPTLSSYWDRMVEKHNHAVKEFDSFMTFKNSLDVKYSFIDFERNISEIKLGDTLYSLKVKHIVYLYMLNLEKDYYVSFESSETTSILHHSDYLNLISNLYREEKEFADELTSYIKRAICPSVDRTSVAMIGLPICEYRTLPLNSLELTKYHRYIATGDYSIENNEFSHWNRIYHAPFVWQHANITADNPLIITEISSISAFVLDYLCYSSMAFTTSDLTRVLSYKVEDGRSINDCIIEKYGNDMLNYINNVINDMNGSMFRSTVYNGILIH